MDSEMCSAVNQLEIFLRDVWYHYKMLFLWCAIFRIERGSVCYKSNGAIISLLTHNNY